MLGQPVSMLIPQVVGFRLDRRAARGLHRHRPRAHRHPDAARSAAWSASSWSSTAPGLPNLPLADRATIGNMSPEYGRHLRRSSRSTPRRSATSSSPAARGSASSWWRPTAGSRACSTTQDSEEATYSRHARARPRRRSSRRWPGPKRPQDRVALTRRRARTSARSSAELRRERPRHDLHGSRRGVAESFPASDPPTPAAPGRASRPPRHAAVAEPPGAASRGAGEARRRHRVRADHGAVVIAAITSCTNTSNPSVMLGAGPAGEEGGGARADAQAVGEDEPRARAPRS